MKDFLELCRARFSCRNYTGESVPREKLERCIEAARLAPSACNSQPWSFVVVDSPDRLADIAKCTQVMDGVNAFTNKAGAFIAVVEEHASLFPAIGKLIESQYFARNDLGAAALAICLEAADQGLGTCIMGIFDRPSLCRLLDIPEEKRISVVIAVGIPADNRTHEKRRRPIGEIVRYV